MRPAAFVPGFSWRANLCWWIFKRSRVARWFFRYLLNQVCYDIEQADFDKTSALQRYTQMLAETQERRA